MTGAEHSNIHEVAQAYLHNGLQQLRETAEIIFNDPETDLLARLQPATEVRRDEPGLSFTPEQEALIREKVSYFGLGKAEDMPSSADYQIMEGGLAWKIAAEATMAKPQKAYIFAGSPYRAVTREDEVAWLQNFLGEGVEVGKTEYDIAKQIAEKQPGFVPEDELAQPNGYDIHNNFAVTHGASGQLLNTGSIDGVPVIMLRVDRENYTDEEGKAKYRKQPDSDALMGIIANVLSARGDETSSIGIVTSNTYPSRGIDAIRAGLKHNRLFDAGMYGRDTLASTGAPLPKLVEIHQIPSELHTIATKLALLQSELEQA